MNTQLLQAYSSPNLTLAHKPIISDHGLKPEDIINVLDNSFDRWTFELESDVVIDNKLITTVTLYCPYGAFTGRGVTWDEDVTQSLTTALLNAADRLITFETPSNKQINSDDINNLISSMTNEQTDPTPNFMNSPVEPVVPSINEAITNAQVNIEPVEEEPVFSADNLMPDPPEPHDGLSNDERELSSRTEIPFDEITPMMEKKDMESLGMEPSIPETFSSPGAEVYKEDIQKFMQVNEIPTRQGMNKWLGTFELGLNNQNITPRKWLEFKAWFEKQRDISIC